ncbi:MAG: YbbR-like domain-containing protein [Clostridiales bacterium]|nr:YbbR-like domain-containing protein [Clostridiales bacterium]
MKNQQETNDKLQQKPASPKTQEKKKKKKRRFSLRKLIYNDKYLIICSIFAAVVIWVLVSMNLSPETTKTVSVPVTVDFTGTVAEQLGISYFDTQDITVQVTVSCKKYIAKDITEDDITATLQTSAITSTGYHSVPITVTADENANFTITNYYPTSAEGLYDVTENASYNVTLNYVNTDFAADGYVAGEASLSESTVVVSGAKTYMSQVAAVVANVELESGLTESQIVDLSPVAVDSSGNPVDYVTVNTADSTLTATVPILKVMTLKPTVNFTNGSDEAISVLDVSYSVSSVKIGALESAGLTALTLGDISFTELEPGENQFTFNPGSVSGVTVLDGTKSITVTVTLPDDYISKTVSFSKNDISLSLPDGYEARVMSVSSNQLTIVGSEETLENITADNVSLSCDLVPKDGSELSEGSAEYSISVVLTDASGCWVLGTYSATISVSK